MATKPTQSDSARSSRQRWLLVFLLSCGLSIDYLARLALFSVVPLWRKDLMVGEVALGLVASSFLWTYGTLSPVAGYLGDRFSRRSVLIASLAAWSVVTLLSGLAANAGQLVAMRILLAMAQVCFMPVGQALIADFHGPDTCGRASGYFQAGASIGVFLSGLPVAWLATHIGWRGMLVTIGALGLGFALLLARWLPHAPSEAAVAPARATRPVTIRNTVGLLRVPSMLVLMVIFSMTSISYWVLFSYLPLFVYEQYHLTLQAAAFQATFFIQTSDVLLMPVYATLSDRWTLRDPRNRYLACALVSALGLPALLAMGAGRQTVVLTGGLVLFGLVMAAADASWLPMLCNVMSPQQRASAYGLLNFSGTLMGGFAAMFTALLMRRLGLGSIIAALGLMYVVIACLLLICGYWLPRRDHITNPSLTAYPGASSDTLRTP
jgi:predicted MFS family arabinose efflux permease